MCTLFFLQLNLRTFFSISVLMILIYCWKKIWMLCFCFCASLWKCWICASGASDWMWCWPVNCTCRLYYLCESGLLKTLSFFQSFKLLSDYVSRLHYFIYSWDVICKHLMENWTFLKNNMQHCIVKIWLLVYFS